MNSRKDCGKKAREVAKASQGKQAKREVHKKARRYAKQQLKQMTAEGFMDFLEQNANKT